MMKKTNEEKIEGNHLNNNRSSSSVHETRRFHNILRTQACICHIVFDIIIENTKKEVNRRIMIKLVKNDLLETLKSKIESIYSSYKPEEELENAEIDDQKMLSKRFEKLLISKPFCKQQVDLRRARLFALPNSELLSLLDKKLSHTNYCHSEII